MRVTVEQFSDTRSVGFPETTLLSVTDNAHTNRDIRRPACIGAPKRGGGLLAGQARAYR